MIRARRIEVGTEPVDLTEESRTSGVSIQYLCNISSSEQLCVGDPDAVADETLAPVILEGGEWLPPITLGATDRLYVWRHAHSAPIDLIVGWG